MLATMGCFDITTPHAASLSLRSSAPPRLVPRVAPRSTNPTRGEGKNELLSSKGRHGRYVPEVTNLGRGANEGFEPQLPNLVCRGLDSSCFTLLSLVTQSGR